MDVLARQSETTDLVLLVILVIGAVGGALSFVLIWYEFREPPEEGTDDE